MFVALAAGGSPVGTTETKAMSSPDGINWTIRSTANSPFQLNYGQVIWIAEVGLFVVVAPGTTGSNNRYIGYSSNGVNWSFTNPLPNTTNFASIAWSPELGMLVAVAAAPATNNEKALYIRLKNRLPTSYNVFDSSFNNIDNSGNWTIKAKEIYGDNLLVNSNVDITGNLDLSCNLILDVSGIYFCDGTYIGQGNSFDISANQVLVLTGVQDPSGNYNGASIVSNDRVFQQLNPDPSWNDVNGYYGLSKDAYPALNPYSSGIQAVSDWTPRTAPEGGWISVCWSPELGLFVAVAFDGSDRVMTSPDGINWTPRIVPNDNIWYSICWSPELGIFVAVAYGGSSYRVMTSPDGINWTPRTVPEEEWLSVCWSAELGIFVAVAYGGSSDRVMTSPDGINWTPRTSANDSEWYSVCWSSELGLFVVVAYDGPETNKRVMTSPDGINWTLRTTPNNNQLQSVCWSPELGIFVAVCGSGSLDRVITSPDGINWTSRTTPNDNIWFSVCWCPELGLFVAVSDGSLFSFDDVMTSPDGINWTSRTTPNNNNWIGICWSPELGLFVSVAYGGSLDRVMTSSLQGRPPTSYNVFDSNFNNIDQSGNWTFKAKSIFSDQDITIDPSNTLIINGNLEVNELTTIKDDLVFVNNGNNVMSFSDFSSNTQNVQLPSIHSQPVSLTRVSLFYNDVSYNLSGTLGASVEVPFGQIIKNQLNLDISGNIISPSLDISGQYVELYVNVEINVGNNTAFQLDISGVDCSFFEIIDNIETTKLGTYYVTFGPHIFMPEQWIDCTQFIFKFVNGRNQVINIQKTKIVFKSYYL
jgi:hypothetical protein